MKSHPLDLDELQDRLTRLEEQNRRFKRLGVAVVVGITLLLIMGQAPARKTVEANEFILKDDSGNVRARLAISARAAGATSEMVLFDEKGNKSVRINGGIRAISSGGGVSIFDPRGQERETLTVLQDSPSLVLKDSKGNNRGIFGFSESHNNTLLAVFDMDGNPRGQFAGGNDGATLELYDSKKALRGIFTGGENGAGLVLVDAKGSCRVSPSTSQSQRCC
ncbi:MAG TPA: hypothetical protein VN822_11240 [Candidatus Acidoferrales bacterium]|nr:hypothetical protein [Candidatus Acidoferrales bacterium]